MRVSGNNRKLIRLLVAAMIVAVAVPYKLNADDKTADDKSSANSAAPPVSCKGEAPASSLTEQGQRPLDCVDQPEKQAAEMETNAQPVVPAASSSPAANSDAQDSQQTAGAAGGQNGNSNKDYTLKGNFFHRLAQFYSQDWAGTNPAGPSPAKAGFPAPLDSPPFPSSDWIYGGAPDIGAPDGNTYPLMSALNLENSRTKVY